MKKLYQVLLVSLTIILQASTLFAQSDPGPVPGCPLVLNPSVSYYSNANTCQVGFVAESGSDCLEILDYSWSVDGSVAQSTGTTALFLYETLDNINSITLTITATNGASEIAASVTLDLTTVTCANSGVTIAPIEGEKLAQLPDSDVNISAVYLGRDFEWIIRLENPIDQLIQFQEFNPIPGGADGSPLFDLPAAADIGCDFVLVGSGGTVQFNNAPPSPVGLSGCIFAPAGVITFTYSYDSCSNTAFSNGNAEWKNCFQYTPVSSCFDPFGTVGPIPSEQVCHTMRTIYGCPGGMTDGYCMDPEDLEINDPIVSKLVIKRSFSYAKSMRGRLDFNVNELHSESLTLSSEFPSTYSMTTTNNGNGVIDFQISSSDPLESVFLGSGGIRFPVEFTALLTNGLEDSCIRINMHDFFIDNAISGEVQMRADPGFFCTDFEISDPPYEPVNIVIDPLTTQCLASGTSITLVADGPFLMDHPATTYLWSPGGETTDSITINSPGEYALSVVDENGCLRENQITVVSCDNDCNCDNVDPVILAVVDGCNVDFSLEMPTCDYNGMTLTYKWVFSNGNSYLGENPPTQTFVGPTAGGPTATLFVYIDGVQCEQPIINDVFVPCRGSKVTMYPNPAKDYLNIDLSETQASSGQVDIYNMFGHLILTEPFTINDSRKTIQCRVAELKQGVYFVRILDNLGNIVDTQRLLID